MEAYDYERVAQEFMTCLRAHRSQVQWSRWLGYKSNVAYPWESGRRYPTAAETLRAISRSGRDLEAGLQRFYGAQGCGWIEDIEPASPEGIAALLSDLRGGTSINDLAEASGLSRFSVSRWLSGRTQPRLPDFFRFVEAASVRLVDFLSAFVDPEQMPSVAPIWRQIETRRNGAARYPWTQVVLRCLELEDYLALPAHRPGWISTRLDLPIDEEARCMAFLEETGQVEWNGTHYQIRPVAVDTRSRPEVGRTLKAHWSEVAQDRIRREAPGQYSYNVFTCSRADFERIRELHLGYFYAMRAIVADSDANECVAVANIQLFALEDHGRILTASPSEESSG